MLIRQAFTLIELLVVIVIVGILSTIGLVSYNGYSKASQKKIAANNFRSTINYLESEISKCILDSKATVFALPCPVQVSSTLYQSCAAIYLSWRYNIRNPLATKEGTGWTASPQGQCPTVVYGDWRGGVRSGNGELDGDVSIVICPRSPYCSSDPKTNGKFKVMWWWDGRKMQEDKIVDVN